MSIWKNTGNVKKGKSKWSVLPRLLVMYLLLIFIVLLLCMPITARSREQLKENYRVQRGQMFDTGIQVLDNSLRQVYALTDVMRNNTYFRSCRYYPRETEIKTFLPNLYMTQTAVSTYLNQIPLAVNAFVYFPNIHSVIDNYTCYLSEDGFTSYGLLCRENGKTADDILQGNVMHYLLKDVSIHNNNAGNVLMMLFDREHGKVRTGVIYDEATLLSLFYPDRIPENSGLRIVDASGETLYSYGQISSEPLFSAQTQYTLLVIEMYLPDTYFDGLLTGFESTLTTVALSAVLIGILLSIGFAWYNYRPVRELLAAAGQTQDMKTDEFTRIKEHIRSTSSEMTDLKIHNQELRRSLSVNYLIRMINGTVYNKKEFEYCEQLIPELRSPCRLVSVTVENDRAAELFASLTQDIPYITLQLDVTRMMILLPAADDILIDMQDRIEKLHETRETDGDTVELRVGFSERFTGAESFGNAWHHAQLAAHGEMICNFYEPSEKEIRQNGMSLADINHLTEMLLSGLENEAENHVRALCAIPTGRGETMQVLSAICLCMNSVVKDSQLTDTECTLTDYNEIVRQDIKTAEEWLCRDVHTLSTALSQRNAKKASAQQERILKYIEENFTKPDICAESIADLYKLSVTGVYQTVRRLTGQTPGDYIEEMRMKEACRLLTETNDTVANVSGRCGYLVPATFYRVFKQHFGVTATQYRKQHGAQP